MITNLRQHWPRSASGTFLPTGSAGAMSLVESFERFFVKTPGKCWEWTGVKNKRGYGRFRFDGKQGIAHRFAYKTYVGPLLPNMNVCHRCDNPSCVNPDHLFLATQGQNISDAVSKGRHVSNFGRGVAHIQAMAITINGETRCLKEWATHFRVNYKTVAWRVWAGMEPLKALLKPSRPYTRRVQ